MQDFRPFILKRSRIIEAEKVYSAARVVLGNGDYKSKKIEKPQFSYMRSNIKAYQDREYVKRCVCSVSKRLEAKYKEQLIFRRPVKKVKNTGISSLSPEFN